MIGAALAQSPSVSSAPSVANDNAVPMAPKPDLHDLRKKFRAFEANKRREMDESQQARRYYHGKQWTDTELEAFRRRKQPVITSNRIKRKVDFLVGVEARMRRDPKAYARGPEDQQSADVATAGLRFVCDVNRWDKISADATHDGLVTGIGVAFVGIEPGRDGPDPKLRLGQVDRFFYDPRSVEPDFTDASYMGMHLWLDVAEAKAKWPEKADAIGSMMDTSQGGLSALKAEEDRDQQWGDFEGQRIRVVEMWHRRPSNVHLAGHAWHFVFFCGDIDLESGVSPYLDDMQTPDCPYVAWSPYVDEKGDRYGMVRDLRPLQDEVNHRRSKFLHMLNTRQWHSRRGAIHDVDAFRAQSVRPDGLLEHEGEEWGKDIGIIDQTPQMQGQAELLTEAKTELDGIGPNPALMGQGAGTESASGRALLTQRDSGMTELAPVFDRLRDWKLRVYRKVWSRLKQAWTGERWIRITNNPDAPQYVGLNQYAIDPQTGQIAGENILSEIDVDIIMEEGPDTITMQDELLERLSNLGPAAMTPIGRIMIELSGTPNKDRLLELMDKAMAPPPTPQPDPIQQAMMEQQFRGGEAKIEQTEAQTAKMMADIENNRADAMARVIEARQPRPEPRAY